LRAELADRFGAHLRQARLTKLEEGKRAIVMGSFSNSLVNAYCAKAGISVSGKSPGSEGYVLRVEPALVLIAGSDDRGAFYGLQSLRQLAEWDESRLHFHGTKVRD
jgi:Glycosyl hydrolase family 20, domain 2